MTKKQLLMIAAACVAPLGMQAMAQAAPEKKPEPVTTPGNGAYPALFEALPSLPNHVVYRPRNMAALGDKKLGLYLFGNGGCSADGTSSRNHLLQIASHGYLAIAPGTIPDPDRKAARPAGPAGQLAADTPQDALNEALEWALKENARQGSPFYNRIATDQIAASGFSCGGLQAIRTGRDPRVKTTVVMNSGVFNEGAPINGITVDKAMVGQLHDSVLYVLGGEKDIAYANGMDDYGRLTLPAAVVNIPVGHGGTYMEPNGGVAAEVVTGWLDWKLKGSATAAAKFQGADCGFCKDNRFTIQRKNLD